MGIAGLFYLGLFFIRPNSPIFTIMTVPVEFDASRRAFRLLDQAGLLVDENDRSGARSMLNAAGFTYDGRRRDLDPAAPLLHLAPAPLTACDEVILAPTPVLCSKSLSSPSASRASTGIGK